MAPHRSRDCGIQSIKRITTSHMDQRYKSGEEIHIGDRIRYAGSPGTIVFVIDRHEYSAKFPAEHWADYQTGFMIQCDSMGLAMLADADEDLELLHPAGE